MIGVGQRDAFEAITEVESGSASCAVVDYPWNFDTANGTDRFGHDQSTGNSDLYETSDVDAPLRDASIESTSLDEVDDEEGLAFVLDELTRIVEDGGWVFVFADDEKYPMFRDIVEDEDGLQRRQTVFWDSDSMGMGYYFRVQAYPIVTATVGETERYVQSRANVCRAHHHSPSAQYHTQKPTELYEWLLQPPVLREGETVFEPFAGTFPAGVVADGRDCSAFGFEISNEALSIVRNRLGDEIVQSSIATT